MEALEKQMCRIRVPAPVHGFRQQRACRGKVTGVVRGHAFLHERLDLALPLGHEPPCAIDIGLGPAVAPIEERDPRPDVDRLLEASGEILIEAGEEQLLDAAFAIASLRVVGNVARRGWRHMARSIRHRWGNRRSGETTRLAAAIIRQPR